jgi:hypothetical protein
VQVQPAALKLEVIAMPMFEHTPRLVVGNPSHAIEQIVRHSRPAIFETVVRVQERDGGNGRLAAEHHHFDDTPTVLATGASL